MQSPLQPLERPPSLHYSVRQAIKEYIINNNLGAGDSLPPETKLAHQLGVSRNSVREAVKALESVGILEVRQGSGVFVNDFSFEPLLENLQYGLLFDLQELADLWQARQILEIGVIEDALQSITAEQLDRLQKVVERMRARAEKGEPFISEDHEFHQLLFANLGNQVILRLLDIFWSAFRRIAEHVDIRDSDPLESYRTYTAILEAVMTGDGKRARAVLEESYAAFKTRLARARQEQDSSPG